MLSNTPDFTVELNNAVYSTLFNWWLAYSTLSYTPDFTVELNNAVIGFPSLKITSSLFCLNSFS
jgi:hypothetical protein